MFQRTGAYGHLGGMLTITLHTLGLVHFLFSSTTSAFTSLPVIRTHPSPRPVSTALRIAGLFQSNAKVGVCNIPGEDFQRPNKVNQDAWFRHVVDYAGCDDDDDEETLMYCVGVLDGHGKEGHYVSNYMAKHLPLLIEEQLNSPQPVVELEERIQELAKFNLTGSNDDDENGIVHQAFVNGFHQVQWNAMADPAIKTGRNGATCVTCLVESNDKDDSVHLHVASVGDSRAISISSNGMISVLAGETTVALPAEMDRINACNGTIRGNNVFYGPVGIAMTRALGDAVMLRAGVVPTPVVQTFHVDKSIDEMALVLATDGVWEVLSNEQVSEIVQEAGMASVQKAANEIAKAAKLRWYGDLPINDEVKMDDITVMVLALDP